MSRDDHLATPWLRPRLVEVLRLLADEQWLVVSVRTRGSGSKELDEALDLLDDTGAVDDPERRVGAFFFAAEVDAARSLGDTLAAALGTADVGLWARVSADARHLLDRMIDPNGEAS